MTTSCVNIVPRLSTWESSDERLTGDVTGVTNWVVVGHSYGGFLAQLYAVRHPGRVAGLVLVAAAERDERTIYAVVMGSEGVGAHFSDVTALLAGATGAPEKKTAARTGRR